MELSEAIDNEIVQYMKRKYSLLIGDRTGEIIKMTIGCTFPDNEIHTLEVKGRDMISGLAKIIEINSEEISEVITIFTGSQNHA